MGITDVLTTILTWINPPAGAAVKTASALKDAYDTMSEEARAKVRLWVYQVKRVQAEPTPSDPELAAWRASILDRANTIKNMIKSIISDDAAKDLGLGSLPLIIGGSITISAILGYITYQIQDIAKYFSRVNLIKDTYAKLTAANVPASEALDKAIAAADSAGTTNDPKIFGVSLKTVGVALVCLGIAGYFWRRNERVK